MEYKFGKINPTFGKEHDYLGMKIHIRDDRKLEIDMSAQIEEILEDFSEDIDEVVTTPATKKLMNVDEESPLLNEEKSAEFHSTTAKLLYLEKRARPDLEPTIAFLTTRVSDPTHEDWLKLRRVLAFLKKPKNDVRVIGCDTLSDIFTWVDAAYAVYNNMWSQTGGLMSLGWGAIHARSSKQKLNTKSSTESELVGLSEYVPYNIWLVNFLTAQGYEIKQNIVYQDNESAIKMAKNGRNSCTGNSRHIHIRYFFVKDRVDKGELSIQYCPTHHMLADYFTKPLQGSLFHKFRNVIMGYNHINTLSLPTEIKERVGNNGKQNRNVISVSEIEQKPNKGTNTTPPLTYSQIVRLGANNTNMKINHMENKHQDIPH